MKIIEEALISCLNFSLKLINLKCLNIQYNYFIINNQSKIKLKNILKTLILSAYLNNGLILFKFHKFFIIFIILGTRFVYIIIII